MHKIHKPMEDCLQEAPEKIICVLEALMGEKSLNRSILANICSPVADVSLGWMLFGCSGVSGVTGGGLSINIMVN